jgi:hypothetical protein
MHRRLPLAVSLTAALLVPAVPAGAAPAADTTPPKVESISLSRTKVTVSGLQTVMVDVRVRITDDTGVETTGTDGGDTYPYVVFSSTPNGFAGLQRTGGTPRDGIWTGQVAVTAAWKGTVRVRLVAAYDMAGNLLSIDPSTVIDTVAVEVRSSHRPAIDMTFPEPATKNKPIVMTVRVWDTDTGRPWPNAPLVIGNDNGCVEWGFRLNARTNRAGIYRRTVPASQAPALHCVWVPGVSKTPVSGEDERTIIAIDAAHLRYQRYTVSAAPVKTAVPARTNVAVNGSASPVNKNKVMRLQRYSGGAWNNVGTGLVRASGRYTVVATPPGKATYSYRVYAPGDGWAVGGTSKVFTIRGT